MHSIHSIHPIHSLVSRRIGYSIPMFAGFIIMFFSTLSKWLDRSGRVF